MYPKFTLEEIQKRLNSVGKNIVLIGEYKSKRTKTTFKHTVCGHEWKTTLDVVYRLQAGCPNCARNSRKLSVNQINSRLKDKNISLIEEYVHALKKTKFKHNICGTEWYSKPTDILNGNHGCPACASHGFKTSKSAWVYIFERDDYLKYGITNNLDERLNSHRRNGNIIIHYLRYFDNGNNAKIWEQNIKKVFGGKFVTKDKCVDGYSETLSVKNYEKLLEFLY